MCLLSSSSLWFLIGWQGNGYSCQDIDECQSNNGGCSLAPLVKCMNTMGSYHCGPCPPGMLIHHILHLIFLCFTILCTEGVKLYPNQVMKGTDIHAIKWTPALSIMEAATHWLHVPQETVIFYSISLYYMIRWINTVPGSNSALLCATFIYS